MRNPRTNKMSFAHVTKKSSLKSLYLPCNCHVIPSDQSSLTTTLPHCNPHPLLSATLTIFSLQLSPHPLCNSHFTPLCNSHFIPLHSTLYISFQHFFFLSPIYQTTKRSRLYWVLLYPYRQRILENKKIIYARQQSFFILSNAFQYLAQKRFRKRFLNINCILFQGSPSTNKADDRRRMLGTKASDLLAFLDTLDPRDPKTATTVILAPLTTAQVPLLTWRRSTYTTKKSKAGWR
jgi:hypothetical protein